MQEDLKLFRPEQIVAVVVEQPKSLAHERALHRVERGRLLRKLERWAALLDLGTQVGLLVSGR